MSMPRIGLIGARRARQGLGPFVARWLQDAGAVLPAFLGTTSTSIAEATGELARLASVTARGYTNLDEFLDQSQLDALAILSPAETHEAYLEAALERGLHVLCEKPLIWGGRDAGARASTIALAFQERGLLLRENCQWPHVLPAFEELHGRVGQLRSFSMRLTPASRGAQMLGDALPHPLSLLQALDPCEAATLEALRLSTSAPDAEEVVLEDDYTTRRTRVPIRVELIRGETLPREAGITINGRVARRRVRMDDYALFLGDGEREVPLKDPLDSLLGSFLADLGATLRGVPPPSVNPIVQRASMLQRTVDSFCTTNKS